jgi:uncharacterized protein YjbI with pentapeptide repeats
MSLIRRSIKHLPINSIFTVPLQNRFAPLSKATDALRFQTRLDQLLTCAPAAKRDALRELSHWLVCCKNLWQGDTPAAGSEAASPFNLTDRFQSLRADPDAIWRTIHTILNNEADGFPAQRILDCVAASDVDDWQALRNQSCPASLIDPSAAPADWPKQCLAWALRTMKMDDADLHEADLSNTDLHGINLNRVDLHKADLSGCDMHDATFKHCNLSEAALNHADMTCSRFYSNHFFLANLADANLSDTTITLCNFHAADMQGCILIRADVRACDMRYAILDHAHMQQADLRGTKLQYASLRHTNLSHANLTGADLCAADGNLSGAIFSGAEIADFGLDIGPFTIAADGAYALRKGLPRELDHIVRDNLRLHMAQYDSDPEGDYLASYTDSDSECDAIDSRDTAPGNPPQEAARTSLIPNWKTTLCSVLLLTPYQIFYR